MPDFEPDPDSVMRGAALASYLAADLREDPEAQGRFASTPEFVRDRYSEVAGGDPINDVLVNVSRMAREFAMARRWDNQIPCLKLDGELAPISAAEYLGGAFGRSLGLADLYEWWEQFGPFPSGRLLQEILRRAAYLDGRVFLADAGEVVEGVERGLSGFLAHRFAGMKQWAEMRREGTAHGAPPPGGSPPGAAGAGPPTPPAATGGGGLQVQVACGTPGLRIHISPAYFISWIYFGSPTTPVSSYVLPGRYVFAGDGPMLPQLTVDNGIFSIPPNYTLTLARF